MKAATTPTTPTGTAPTTEESTAGSVPRARTAELPPKTERKHMITALAELQGNIASAFGLLGAAIGVGLIGFKAAEAVGRNPGASGKVLVQAIIGMALAEGLGILALFLAK